MDVIPINFVTTDFSRWGAGLNRLLDASEIDRNFWELVRAVTDLTDNPPAPIQIASFGISGVGMTITMSNGTTAGPLALPVLTWRWRAAWLPLVPYLTLDVFSVEGIGIFLVLRDHTSAATFDPAATLGGDPLYQQLFGVFGTSQTTLIAADGSDQATATALTTQQNYVSSGIDGVKGVRVEPNLMIPGNHIYATNEDPSNTLIVYPGSGISINNQIADAPISILANTTAEFLVKDSLSLRTIP